MTRIFGQNISPEMVALWLLETTICFLVLLLGAVTVAPAGGAVGHIGGGLGAGLASQALLVALTLGLVGFAIGLYQPETFLETRRLALKAGVAAGLSLPAIWILGKITGSGVAGLFGLNPTWPLELLLAWALLLLGTRMAYSAGLRMNLFVRRLAILGDGAAAQRTVAAIASSRRGHFQIEVAVPATALPGSPPRRLWGLVVAEPGQAVPAGWGGSVRVLDAASFWENQLGRIDTASIDPAHSARFADAALHETRTARIARRGFDILGAGLLLVLTAPLMAFVAMAIRLESPGGALYRQERVGLGGRSFTLLKFRSMRADAEHGGPVWAQARDPRVTRIGAFIRKVRIDELPQLFNILRGEMSVVGPRPERPHFVEQLAQAIPFYRARTQVKPGLTGWAQVNYPYGASVEDARQKLSYDLYYVKQRSLLLDVLILLATIRVVLFQEGAR